MKPIGYYVNKIVSIFSPECPKYSGGCYSWDNDERLYPCEETRGWISDGTRCRHIQEKNLLSRLAERITEDLLHIGGLKE